jgi:hypothetical protein
MALRFPSTGEGFDYCYPRWCVAAEPFEHVASSSQRMPVRETIWRCPAQIALGASCKLHYIDADHLELMYSPSLANRPSLLSARPDVISEQIANSLKALSAGHSIFVKNFSPP